MQNEPGSAILATRVSKSTEWEIQARNCLTHRLLPARRQFYWRAPWFHAKTASNSYVSDHKKTWKNGPTQQHQVQLISLHASFSHPRITFAFNMDSRAKASSPMPSRRWQQQHTKSNTLASIVRRDPHVDSWNCTKPKPRGSPVILLRIKMTSFREPHFPKWVLSISSVVCHVRPPRKIFPSTSASVKFA